MARGCCGTDRPQLALSSSARSEIYLTKALVSDGEAVNVNVVGFARRKTLYLSSTLSDMAVCVQVSIMVATCNPNATIIHTERVWFDVIHL